MRQCEGHRQKDDQGEERVSGKSGITHKRAAAASIHRPPQSVASTSAPARHKRAMASGRPCMAHTCRAVWCVKGGNKGGGSKGMGGMELRREEAEMQRLRKEWCSGGREGGQVEGGRVELKTEFKQRRKTKRKETRQQRPHKYKGRASD